MLIRSKIARFQPGVNPPEPIASFFAEFGPNRERKYEFKLDANGDHVCDVNHREDAQALIAITEGYEIHPKVLDEMEGKSRAATQERAARAAREAEEDQRRQEEQQAAAQRKAEAEARAAKEKAEREEADARAKADAAAKGSGRK
jgi:colicin import membrane protein